MTIDHRSAHLAPVRSVLGFMLSPLQYVVDLPARAGFVASDRFTTRQNLMHNNETLSAERVLLHGKLQKFNALEQENIRLRQLLKTATRFEQEQFLIAELLSVDLDPYKQRIMVNKGSRDGVFVGQPLLDTQGVMGQIMHVTPLSSTAILISDPSHAIPVKIDRNGLRTLAVGTGGPERLELQYIPTNSDIEVGDIVSTSGLGQRYPANYPVARITHIERPSGKPFAIVDAQPLALLDRSREVLLVWPNFDNETPATDDASSEASEQDATPDQPSGGAN